MKKFILILILIIAFNNFVLATTSLKWKRDELLGILSRTLPSNSTLVKRAGVCPGGFFACAIGRGCCPNGSKCVANNKCTVPCPPGAPSCNGGCCLLDQVCGADGFCQKRPTPKVPKVPKEVPSPKKAPPKEVPPPNKAPPKNVPPPNKAPPKVVPPPNKAPPKEVPPPNKAPKDVLPPKKAPPPPKDPQAKGQDIPKVPPLPSSPPPPKDPPLPNNPPSPPSPPSPPKAPKAPSTNAQSKTPIKAPNTSVAGSLASDGSTIRTIRSTHGFILTLVSVVLVYLNLI
ncbi:hypothetical protein C1645_737981 [Glomus cerebriforme]|uniref:Uncharacterized protein n=1 Tax=Glomus cerebriforme TaxID=658196 RepID=A0A397T536_9GLOM|nr:hypothetical protein C1645_737981 [Glomus cerebriforme]